MGLCTSDYIQLDSFRSAAYTETAKAIGSNSIRHRSCHSKVSERCEIEVDHIFFVICIMEECRDIKEVGLKK